MRLTPKKIEEIMLSVLGEAGLPLIKELTGRENVSEFELATKTKKDIKIVRKMLYLLYNQNLISFTRKKDKQKGWYIYYWTLLPESIKFNYFKRKKEQLERLQQRVEEEGQEIFFICSNNCIRLNFDQSVDFEFHCPECGELISQDENKGRMEKINKEIAHLQEELELATEQRKIKRKIIKVHKKEIKKKVITKKTIKAKKKELKKKIIKIKKKLKTSLRRKK